MKRFPNWLSILYQQLQDRRNQEFQYGVADCVLTFADIVQSYTGTDIAVNFRNKYFDEASAKNLIADFDGGLIGQIRRELSVIGLKEIKPIIAKRGDFTVIKSNQFEQVQCGIFDSSGIITTAKVGFTNVPRSSALLAWEIPF